MRGMILAAGLGTRLRPLTWFRAKPAIPFLGRPLIRYAMELLEGLGVSEPVVNLHHLADTVRAAAGSSARFSYEPEVLGTAGALAHARPLLAGEGTVVLVNGKIYYEGSLEEAWHAHRAGGAAVTLVVKTPDADSPFNPVYADIEGRIRLFGGIESRFGYGAGPDDRPYIFTGIHFIEPEVLDRIPMAACDTVRDIYPSLILEGAPLQIWVSPAFWCEMSTPRRYLDASLEVWRRSGRNGSAAAETSVVDPGAVVEAGAAVEESVCWPGATISRGSRLRRVILADGAGVLPPGTHLENCIVTADPAGCSDAQKEGSELRDGRRIWPLRSDGCAKILWGGRA